MVLDVCIWNAGFCDLVHFCLNSKYEDKRHTCHSLDTSWLIHTALSAESCLSRCSVHVSERMRCGDVMSAKVVSVYQAGLSLCRNQTSLCVLTTELSVCGTTQLDVLTF